MYTPYKKEKNQNKKNILKYNNTKNGSRNYKDDLKKQLKTKK